MSTCYLCGTLVNPYQTDNPLLYRVEPGGRCERCARRWGPKPESVGRPAPLQPLAQSTHPIEVYRTQPSHQTSDQVPTHWPSTGAPVTLFVRAWLAGGCALCGKTVRDHDFTYVCENCDTVLEKRPGLDFTWFVTELEKRRPPS